MSNITADYGRLDRKEAELEAQRAPTLNAPANPADAVALLLKVNPHVPAEERFRALTRSWKAPR